MPILHRVASQKYALLFWSSLFALTGALVLQHWAGWEPCPLCILQRIASISMLFFSLIGLLSSRNSGWKRIGIAGTTLSALGGLASSVAHLWVIWGPESQSCGPGVKLWVAQLVDALPGSGWLFQANGDCALSIAQLLGAPLPVWAAVVFGTQLVVISLPSGHKEARTGSLEN